MYRAKKDKKLPIVLSKEEVGRILRVIGNVKHKLLIALVYSSGLRISEVVRLHVGDLNFYNSTINIRAAKGRKDRVTIMSRKVAGILERYIKNKKTDDYVFVSLGGGRLCERTAQIVFQKSLIKSGVRKEASIHSLRHSFATHLLEDGTDIRYIQALLGHTRLETTQIYTQVASGKINQITSPLDIHDS